MKKEISAEINVKRTIKDAIEETFTKLIGIYPENTIIIKKIEINIQQKVDADTCWASNIEIRNERV